MYVLYEDAGRFHAGRVMTEAESSLQIELDSGKRVKVKSGNVMLRFEKPQPADLITSAQALAKDIDLDLAWEFAPDQEFGFVDLARDYFEASAGVEKQAAATPLKGKTRERSHHHHPARHRRRGDRVPAGLLDRPSHPRRRAAWL